MLTEERRPAERFGRRFTVQRLVVAREKAEIPDAEAGRNTCDRIVMRVCSEQSRANLPQLTHFEQPHRTDAEVLLEDIAQRALAYLRRATQVVNEQRLSRARLDQFERTPDDPCTRKLRPTYMPVGKRCARFEDARDA